MSTLPEEIIKVEDYIIPAFNDEIFYIVHSTWSKKNNEGFVFVEKIDSRSFFYPIKRTDVAVFKDINQIKEYHISLIKKYDWRHNHAEKDKNKGQTIKTI